MTRRIIAGALCMLAWALACGNAFAARQLSLDVELDPRSRRLSASAQLTPAQAPFRFVLHESLSVQQATSGGSTLQARVVRSAGGLREWQIEAPPHEPLRIEYAGTLPGLDASLDHRGVLRRLPPMASDEGSFLNSGSGWYPAPAELFSYQARLSVHGGHKALVAGKLVSEEQTGGVYRASFEFSAPTDGIDLMAGRYEMREREAVQADGRPLRLRTYFFPDLAALADGYLEDSLRYVERYSRAIGAYPFTEFSVVASPLPTGFGMPTLTYIGANVLKLPFIRATSLGHEVLHNWWGNGVYVDYARGNWSEGLTTFMADYAYKEDESPDAAREMRLSWLRDFAAIPKESNVALASFRARTHGAAAAVGYGKAAMLFAMTRDLIGEEAFNRGLRRFWEMHRFKSASWDDLRAAFEHASGRSLAGFFRQWLERPGGPAVHIASAKAGAGQLELEIEQGEPPYRLRLPVELASAGRAHIRHVEVDQPRQTVRVEIGSMPETVRLDPELRIWRLLAADELPPILRQWTIARAPIMTPVSGGAARRAADALAGRFFETPPRVLALDSLPAAGEPVLIVGLHEDVDAALARLGLPPRPPLVGKKGSAQVWTIAQTGRPARFAAVSAQDAGALMGLLRPLPHYGSQSYLVFEGSRALERGVWPPAIRTLRVTR